VTRAIRATSIACRPGADELEAVRGSCVSVLQRGQHLDPATVTSSIDMVNAQESPEKVLTDD